MFLRTAHGDEWAGVLHVLEYKQIGTNCGVTVAKCLAAQRRVIIAAIPVWL